MASRHAGGDAMTADFEDGVREAVMISVRFKALVGTWSGWLIIILERLWPDGRQGAPSGAGDMGGSLVRVRQTVSCPRTGDTRRCDCA